MIIEKELARESENSKATHNIKVQQWIKKKATRKFFTEYSL